MSTLEELELRHAELLKKIEALIQEGEPYCPEIHRLSEERFEVKRKLNRLRKEI